MPLRDKFSPGHCYKCNAEVQVGPVLARIQLVGLLVQRDALPVFSLPNAYRSKAVQSSYRSGVYFDDLLIGLGRVFPFAFFSYRSAGATRLSNDCCGHTCKQQRHNRKPILSMSLIPEQDRRIESHRPAGLEIAGPHSDG